ncbi:MAG TPA: hypothetical protein VH227_05890 [Candidatus Udaeobacter sp.]|jgi:hypothetical protein|nr:hypothetical protein [Candidatus Udaeobacter sp.]
MKTLIKALAVVCIAAIAVFAALRLAGTSEEVAKSISVLVLGSITYVHKTLEKDKKQSGLSLTPQGIVDREGYKLNWALLSIYSAIILFVTLEFAALLGRSVALALKAPSGTSPGVAVGLGHLLLTCPVTYLLGRWIGHRADKHLVLATLLFTAIVRVAEAAREYFTNTDQLFYVYYGFAKDSPRFLITIAGGTVLFWLIALAGMWRGYRTRLKAYVGYLLKRLPPDSQKAVVDLVYQEAAMQAAH